MTFVRESVAEIQTLRIGELQFWHRDAADLMVVSLLGLVVVALAVRCATPRWSRRDRLALPAVLTWMRRSSLSFVRHGPLLPFLAGMPFFVVAFADPYTAFTREEASFPGRRIAIMIDASSSMLAPFRAERLNSMATGDAENAFHTSVAAAGYFVRLRMQSQYRDLMGLDQPFGHLQHTFVLTADQDETARVLVFDQLAGEFDSVHLRHIQVEQDQVRRRALRIYPAQGCGAVVAACHGIES